MGEHLTFLLVMLVRYGAVVAIAGLSGYLAWHKIDGWGWFLFVAFVVAVSGEVHVGSDQ